MTIDQLFIEWFLGFVEAERKGSFTISKQPNRITYSYTLNVAQSNYNLMCFNHIKDTLGVGRIIPNGPNVSRYVIQDKGTLKNYIIPIFERYPLLTSKYYNYDLFLRALFTDIHDILALAEFRTLYSQIPITKHISLLIQVFLVKIG